MTLTEALDIATKDIDRIGVNIIYANDPQTTSYNNESIMAFNMIIEAAKRFNKLSQYATNHTFAEVIGLTMKEEK